MSIIKAKGVSKQYLSGKVLVNALNRIDFEVSKGEFTAIVGPSGSGKSTFLNLIGGLDKPTSGKVEIKGVDIAALTENKMIEFRLKNIGFVFQAYNLIPVLTAKENVEFNLHLLKMPKPERKQRVEELLTELGLEDKMNRRPFELSGGEQQRVAVARALAAKPQFVLADEPTANLDSKTTSNLLNLMWRMCEKENTTFIFSTHDHRVIEKARRVVVLEDGAIFSDSEQRHKTDSVGPAENKISVI